MVKQLTPAEKVINILESSGDVNSSEGIIHVTASFCECGFHTSLNVASLPSHICSVKTLYTRPLFTRVMFKILFRIIDLIIEFWQIILAHS